MVCLPALIRSGSSSPSIGKRPHAQHAVLALQRHVHARRNVVRHQGRDADAEIDVEAVLQFLRGARGHLVAGPGHQTCLPGRRSCASARLRDGALLDPLLVVAALDDALHEDARRVDLVGIELAGRDQLLDFGDA